ncbi:hypothetical protein ACFOVU_26210 [Nocardiopsis sediminis]|uniref:Phenylacetate--CoA ligase family protein n=1 Tax=Nocardiopsis sediminis TaxID=1778267 RepID=A0ABV8FWE8_9ACTN
MTATPRIRAGTSWLRCDARGGPDARGRPDDAPSGPGLLLVPPGGGPAAVLSARDRAAGVAVAAQTLAGAGIGSGDRVVAALNDDGEPTGGLLAEAAVAAGAAAASVGPRGRMRLLRTLEAVGATALAITPTGAMDLLARLHLEFLADPLDLGLRRLLLVGEITGEATRRHLAAEFGAEVTDLFTDPLLHVAIAHRGPGEPGFTPAAPGLLGLAPLAEDTLLAAPYPAGAAEIVTAPAWHTGLAGATVRTGLVAVAPDGAPAVPPPAHTVGDEVLVRGRRVALPGLERALAGIDGIAHWDLWLRREGTLDTATLRVTFTRGSLVADPMWRSRIEQSLTDLSPVRIGVQIEEHPDTERRPATVTDTRGHHLGRDRTTACPP